MVDACLTTSIRPFFVKISTFVQDANVFAENCEIKHKNSLFLFSICGWPKTLSKSNQGSSESVLVRTCQPTSFTLTSQQVV